MKKTKDAVGPIARFALAHSAKARQAVIEGAREELLRMLEEDSGNVEAVAERLAVTRQTVYNHLSRLKIDPTPYRPARRGRAA